MPALPGSRRTTAAVQVAEAQVIALREDLAVARNNEELAAERLEESFADVELALEDRGWWALTSRAEFEFTRTGLGRAAQVARVAVQVNPLLKRAMALRSAYVWGQGVAVSARDEKVNEVIQAHLDDPGNQAALFSDQAHERLERTYGTDGNLLIVAFTNPRTGRVQFRTMIFDEVLDVITNPEDRNEPWFYLRQWSTRGLVASGSGVGGATVNQVRRAYYPALGYFPASRPPSIDGIPVAWGSPVLHAKVNDLDGWAWGIGDLFPALGWARMYGEFLNDWARIARALSKFVWRLTGDRSSKAQKAAQRIQETVGDVTNLSAGRGPVAQMTASGPGLGLEAIPKTGATLDAHSGKPIAAMVASAMGVPVTMLLADPGQTGARAVAETLDRPTELEMQQRQQLHATVLGRLFDYVVDQAVIAPAGPLKGTIARDPGGNGLTVTLAGGVERTVDIVFPPLNEQDPAQVVTAVVNAESTGTLPPEVVARLLLQALHVEDVDEILTSNTDEQGRYVKPGANAGQAAVDAFRRGQDPAAVLNGTVPQTDAAAQAAAAPPS